MKKITCEEARTRLLDYAEGEVDDVLREHLASCPDCRAELLGLENARSVLERESVPDPGAAFWGRFPDQVWKAYRAELAAERREPRASASSIAQWWASLGLRLQFNLVFIAVFALGLGAIGWIAYGALQTNARQEIVREARLILETTLAMRGYTIAQVSPLLPHDSENFHLQAVPPYAVSEMMSRIGKKYVNYSYKDVALNPMNPRNRAVGWEADIIGSFRDNPGKNEISGVHDTPAGPHFYIARPTKVFSRTCLDCHTSPEVAPAALVRAYGRINGYGWKYQETVGAQIVSVPISLALHNANRTFLALMVTVTGVFALLLVVLNIWLGVRVLHIDGVR
jgi:hypothetical protein